MFFENLSAPTPLEKFLDPHPGADLGFSWGGGGGRIFKKRSKILTTFFF